MNLQAFPRNHHQWVSIADFLDSQFLAGFGLRRVAACGERSAAAATAAPRVAHPVGNTGITYTSEVSNNV